MVIHVCFRCWNHIFSQKGVRFILTWKQHDVIITKLQPEALWKSMLEHRGWHVMKNLLSELACWGCFLCKMKNGWERRGAGERHGEKVEEEGWSTGQLVRCNFLQLSSDCTLQWLSLVTFTVCVIHCSNGAIIRPQHTFTDPKYWQSTFYLIYSLTFTDIEQLEERLKSAAGGTRGNRWLLVFVITNKDLDLFQIFKV